MLESIFDGWPKELIWAFISAIIGAVVSWLLFGRSTAPVSNTNSQNATNSNNTVNSGNATNSHNTTHVRYEVDNRIDNRVIIDQSKITNVHREVTRDDKSDDDDTWWVAPLLLTVAVIAVAAVFERYLQQISAAMLAVTVFVVAFDLVALLAVRHRAALNRQVMGRQVAGAIMAGLGLWRLFQVGRPAHEPPGYGLLVTAARRGTWWDAVQAYWAASTDPAIGLGSTLFVAGQALGAALFALVLLALTWSTLVVLATVARTTGASASPFWTWVSRWSHLRWGGIKVGVVLALSCLLMGGILQHYALRGQERLTASRTQAAVPAPANTFPGREITLADRQQYSKDVVRVQRKLHQLGYKKVEPDGHYGPATQTAVKDFQRGQGLPATGTINARTWTALNPS